MTYSLKKRFSEKFNQSLEKKKCWWRFFAKTATLWSVTVTLDFIRKALKESPSFINKGTN